MCYAIPGQVKSFDGKFVLVDYFGEQKKAINELSALKVGDYVYAQGGFVITKVSQSEALQTLETWKDLFFELKDIDDRSVKDMPWAGAKFAKVRDMFDCVSADGKISLQDLQYLLSSKDAGEREFIRNAANQSRHKYHGNSCCVHGIIEIGNVCDQVCHYCGISRLNTSLTRYRMSKEEILESVRVAVEDYGFKALVLQSGEDADRPIIELVDIVTEIKKRFGVLIFVSFGEVGREGLEQLYTAGARGLLLRFESSNPNIYQELHPGSNLDDRLKDLRYANELGYLIITGSLVGLPGQTAEDISRDIQLAGELNVEMLSMGPFLPHPHTPLAHNLPPTKEAVVQVLAAARFYLPSHVKILVTTGLETLNAEARELAFRSGANSMMLNVTPQEKKLLYEIYPDRAHQNESLAVQIDSAKNLLQSLGRAPTDLSFR
ncbi:MAG: [FeFe] hydrogenase H-cluster radical SAM maturase HydE [Candidatus Omnitrophica bacterium]|nr:[FeFe] hydrogenase H-cluster radical SAM maturase HydE [Candidatus Omnitrophota bacterium]